MFPKNEYGGVRSEQMNAAELAGAFEDAAIPRVEPNAADQNPRFQNDADQNADQNDNSN